jgi:nicotinate phosphoribosyltransferase
VRAGTGRLAEAIPAFRFGLDELAFLEAGRRYGIPTAGTGAHTFVLAHGSEREAFDAQLAALGLDTTLLVDTHDVPNGIDTAVAAARARRSLGAEGRDLAPGPPALTVDRRALGTAVAGRQAPAGEPAWQGSVKEDP